MKKTLLALAVLASFAGVASAQTSVTVYGLVDAGITSETGGAGGSVLKLATGVQSGNRLGFKGTEDLGGGLKANFQLEEGFNLDTGTGRQGALFGRQAYVGLSGNFGAVNLGRQYNPFFVSLDAIDPFGTGLTGATTNLMNSSSVRTNNAITYSTPGNLGGFNASVLYGLGEVVGDRSLNRTIDASVGYANGPVAVTFAYDNVNVTATNTSKLALLGGTFDFGPVKAHAAVESEKDDVGTDFRDYMVGLSAPVGAGTILASYIKKTDKSASGNFGSKQLAIGYTYAMSKRTNLYTSYGRIRNDSAAAFFVGDASSGGTAPSAGGNSGALTVGIRHKF